MAQPRVEYWIEMACEPRRHFGREGLLARLRRLRWGAGSDSGPEQTSQALEAGFELRPFAFHCARCPANHRGCAFGCFGTIQAPVSPRAEHWLIDLLPASLKARPKDPPQAAEQIRSTRELLRQLQDRGRKRDACRSTGILVEGSRRAVRRYGNLLGPARLTSSQLLELLFQEQVEPTMGEVVCRSLALWEDGVPGHDRLPQVVFTQPVREDDDPSVAELKQFLLALLLACSLDVPVRTEINGLEAK